MAEGSSGGQAERGLCVSDEGRVKFNCDRACHRDDCAWCVFITQKTDPDTVWFLLQVKQRALLFEPKLAAAEGIKRRSQGEGRYTCQHVTYFDVDVTINRHNGNTSTEGAASAVVAQTTRETTQTVHVDSARHVTVQAISVPVNLHVTQAQLQQLTDDIIRDAVEDVVVAQVVWSDSQVQKFKDKYRREKQQGEDCRAWFEQQIHNMEAQIRVEQLAGDMELENAKKEEEEKIRSITKQLTEALSMSERERASCNQSPSDLISMLAQRHSASEQQVSTLSEKLQGQQREKEEQLAALKQCYEEEKKREEEKVMLFTIKVEERDEAVLRQLAVGMNTEQLRDVITSLFRDHNIRLMGVDCGLSFLLEASVSQWREVVEKQLAIQETLSRLLPDDGEQSASWSDVTLYSEGDVDIRLGYPVRVMGDPMSATPQRETDPMTATPQREMDPMTATPQREMDPMTATPQREMDPMTPTPQRVFSFHPKTAGDRKEAWITSIASTQDGALVMTDNNNSKVKVTDTMSPPSVTASITLDETPWCVAVLTDGLIATTTKSNVIYFLSVAEKRSVLKTIRKVVRRDSTSSMEIRVQSRVETRRQYRGIASYSDHTIMVSCVRDDEGPVSVDEIDREGRVLRTIVDSDTLTGLSSPRYLCTVGSHVLVSDCDTNKVLKVDVTSGQLLDQMTHSDMKGPSQVCVDKAGNLYIASEGGRCVLVRSPRGEWRRLLDARQHSEEGYKETDGVCVTSTGVVFVAWSTNVFPVKSIVTCHALK